MAVPTSPSPSTECRRHQEGALRIAIDEGIQLGAECFADAGDVKAMPTLGITRDRLMDVDALVVRSVTRVDEALLAGTPVRFVGSVTSGVDHVDLSYLRREGIEFANAPGCNANSVAEYVVAALLSLHERGAVDLHRTTLGVVGVGHVGSRVVEKAGVLGLGVVPNDPPRARREDRTDFAPLTDALACDVVSLHVPLTRTGEDATFRLLDEERLRHMKPGAVLVNTARGEVVDAGALLTAVREGRLAAPVLDVWPGEPRVSGELITATALATPHVAGHSWEGKTNGTVMVYRMLCRFLGVSPVWEAPQPPVHTLLLPAEGVGRPPDASDVFPTLHQAASAAYDIEADSAALKQPRSDFEALRASHAHHAEFGRVRVEGASTRSAAVLGRLGFRTGA